MKKSAEQLVSEIDSSLSYIDEMFLKLDQTTIIDFITANKQFALYQFYIDTIFRKRDHMQKDESSQRIKSLKDEINDCLTMYNQLIHSVDLGTMKIDQKEIELQPSNISKYLSSRDRETRRQAYLSINHAYEKKQDNFANILNQIYTDRVAISNLEGYSSVLEKRLVEENINPKIVTKLIASVYEHLNIMQKYLKIKTKLLNIDDPHLYDYGVPLDQDDKKKYSLADAIAIIKQAVAPLGKEYLKIIDELIEQHHIDAALDQSKHQSITFSWSSYSFLNYREAYHDLKNLAHELGHSINAYLSEQNQPYLYSDSTVFIGETASLVNELLLNQYLFQQATNEKEKIFYLSTMIEDYFVKIFKQTMYTEFESKLYEAVQNGVELTASFLKKEFSILQKQYFGEFTTYDNCASVEWSRLGHLYRWSYYVYQYATGFMMASLVTNEIINKKEGFIEKYLTFLSSGSNNDSIELLKQINVDFSNKDMFDHSFLLLEQNISMLQTILKVDSQFQ